MYWGSSMSQLLLLLPMVWTRNQERKTSLYSILVVVLLMCHYWLLIMECLKLFPLPEIPTWEEKTLIKDLPNISAKFSRRRTHWTSKLTQKPCKSWSQKLRKPREIYHQSIKSRSPLKTLWTELTSQKPSPEQDLKNSVMIFSKRLFNQFNKFLMMQEWRNQILMK